MSFKYIKFQHGFDADRALALFNVANGPGTTPDAAYGRRGDLGIRISSDSNAIRAELPDGLLAKPVTGFCIQFNASSGNGLNFFCLGETNIINHMTLQRDANGAILLKRGDGTQIAISSNGVAPMSTKLFIVVDVISIHDSTGAVDVWINGVRRINATGLDNRNGGTAGQVDQLQWGHGVFTFGNVCNYDICDIYCMDRDDADYPGIMHDWRLEKLLVTGEGSNIDWTPSTGTDNALTVDEIPFTATEYNESNLNGDMDELVVANGTLTDPIRSIAVIGQIAAASGVAAARLGIKSGSNYGTGIDRTGLSTTPRVVQDIWTKEPSSGTAWDTTLRDAIQATYENIT